MASVVAAGLPKFMHAWMGAKAVRRFTGGLDHAPALCFLPPPGLARPAVDLCTRTRPVILAVARRPMRLVIHRHSSPSDRDQRDRPR